MRMDERINFRNVAKRCFQVVRGHFPVRVSLFTEEGKLTAEPKDAKFIFCEILEDRNISADDAGKFEGGPSFMVTVEKDGDDSTIKLSLSSSLHIQHVKSLIERLKSVARNFSLLFDVKTFGYNLSPKDFANHVTPVNEKELFDGYGTEYDSLFEDVETELKRNTSDDLDCEVYPEGTEESVKSTPCINRHTFTGTEWIKDGMKVTLLCPMQQDSISAGACTYVNKKGYEVRRVLYGFNIIPHSSGVGRSKKETVKEALEAIDKNDIKKLRKLVRNCDVSELPYMFHHIDETFGYRVGKRVRNLLEDQDEKKNEEKETTEERNPFQIEFPDLQTTFVAVDILIHNDIDFIRQDNTIFFADENAFNRARIILEDKKITMNESFPIISPGDFKDASLSSISKDERAGLAPRVANLPYKETYTVNGEDKAKRLMSYLDDNEIEYSVTPLDQMGKTRFEFMDEDSKIEAVKLYATYVKDIDDDGTSRFQPNRMKYCDPC